jgi:hypothetical protein
MFDTIIRWGGVAFWVAFGVLFLVGVVEANVWTSAVLCFVVAVFIAITDFLTRELRKSEEERFKLLGRLIASGWRKTEP